jgi:hypothetical protein
MKRLVCLAALTLSACGGGGSSSPGSPSSSPPPPATNADPGGIWNASYTASNGVAVQALAVVTEDGRYLAIGKNLSNDCADIDQGNIAVSGTTFTGTLLSAVIEYSTFNGVAVNCAYADGSTWATGTITGSLTQRSSLETTITAKTGGGTSLGTQSNNWTYNNLYNEPSTLARLTGNWSLPDGSTLTIHADGSYFIQQASTGCVINGQYSTINTSYNAYAESASYASCTGAASVLNGLTATGLAFVDDTVSPLQLDGGGSVTLSNGEVIMAVATATWLSD